MATTARHTIARNHSEYDHCITLRVSHYLTQKNHVKTIYKYSVLHGQYTSTPNYTAKYKYIMHLYPNIKHTHSTRDHTGTRASKHLCLTVLPRKTSISKVTKNT